MYKNKDGKEQRSIIYIWTYLVKNVFLNRARCIPCVCLGFASLDLLKQNVVYILVCTERLENDSFNFVVG